MGPIFKPAGFLRLATITRTDPSTMTAFVTFRDSIVGSDDSSEFPAQLPIAFLSAGGGFIGGAVADGTPVVVSQAEGSGNYFIVSFLARDPASRSSISNTNIQIPEFVDGEIVIQANTNGSINLNDDGITIGEPHNAVIFDTTRKILLNSFDYNYNITQASKEITGVIKRDRKPKLNFAPSLRDQDPAYDDNLKIIGMDPVSDARNSNIGTVVRNPARIEKRELVFEYEEFAKVKSNDIELNFYKTGKFPDESNIIDRRETRVDTLSLSLTAPNYLMETTKGTVVDVFGNILDLNRDILSIGGKDLSASKIKSTVNETSSKNIYEQIKRIERRSIAYHFELNARKEVVGSGPPDPSKQIDYVRDRSRFFFDIDKEGQFKLNVPASSETGNIPLLTRHENFSTTNPNSSSNNPNDTVFNEDYRDIVIEPFLTTQVIELKDDAGNTVGPINRFSDINNPQYIKHGTVYHDISKTCNTFQSGVDLYTPVEYTTTSSLASGRITPKNDIVSKTIITSGDRANAGGRSGSLNFDGSVEVNIGANTVDRQSLWMDLQGGAIINCGRDLQNVSLAANFDGEVLIQVGGATVPAETKRFNGSNTGWISGVVEFRVARSVDIDGKNHEFTILRIDNEGLTITTPGRVVMSSNGDFMIRSSGTLTLDAEHLVLNSREVVPNEGAGQIR
jgi:hypothetical protein